MQLTASSPGRFERRSAHWTSIHVKTKSAVSRSHCLFKLDAKDVVHLVAATGGKTSSFARVTHLKIAIVTMSLDLTLSFMSPQEVSREFMICLAND
jgi:hypothetical protein